MLSVSEAAGALGVTPQRVRQLIKDGRLDARRSSGGWLVPEAAVHRRRGHVASGRPIGPKTAWAAISLLAEGSVPDRRLRHRVLNMLAALPDPIDEPAPWVRLLSARGVTRRMWCHPGVLDQLIGDARVSAGGDRAVRLPGEALTRAHGSVSLYVRSDNLSDVIQRYRLRDDPNGSVTLMVVPANVPAALTPTPGEPVPKPAAVADLLDEPDVRARHAALHRLRELRWEIRQ